MASRSLGVLTYSLIAEIGGFVGGMDKAGRIADQKSKEILAMANKVGTAAGAAVTAAAATVTAWTKGVADMAIEAEKLAGLAGTTTQTFQGLAFGAKSVGIENEKLADIFKDVQDKVGDFLQTGAGPMADFFENIAPKVGVTAAQFRKLSGPEALQLYVSSLEKAKVSQSEMTFFLEAIASDATALLPLLRNNGTAWQDLSKQASAYGAVLSTEVIEQSKELQRQVQALEGMYQGLKNEVGTATIPVLTALARTIQDVANDTNQLGTAASGLRNSDALRKFAEDGGRELAKLADYIAQSKREFLALVDFAESSFKASKAYLSMDIEGGRKISEDFRKRYGLNEWGVKVMEGEGAKLGKTFTEAFDAQLAAGARSRFALNDPRRTGAVGSIAQQTALAGIGTGTKPKTGGGGNTAAQEAAAQLSADLAEITRQRDAFLNTYKNSEAVLQAMRSAGLTEESAYFREKGLLLDKQTKAEVDALNKTIARLQQEKLGGADAIKNAQEIEKAQAELAKVRENAAAQAKVFSIEEQAAFKQIENSILAAKQAAQGYLDTMAKGLNAELAGAGLGNKGRERSGRVTALDEDFERRRQDLLNLRRLAEVNGPLGPDGERKYQEDLKLINDGNAAALQMLTAYYAKVDELQGDWKVGALESLNNYFDETQNIAKQTEEIFTSAFKGMEDALADFTKTGKLDMKGLVDSILADITRMTIRSQITGPLAEFMKGTINGSAGSSAGGGWLGGILSAASGWFGGARANGGPVEAGKLYQVGERGSELYNVGGAQFLIPGANGSITPNHRMGGQGFSQVNNISIQGHVDRRTADQIAMDVARRSRTALMRNG